jgi:hypothetical protein
MDFGANSTRLPPKKRGNSIQTNCSTLIAEQGNHIRAISERQPSKAAKSLTDV